MPVDTLQQNARVKRPDRTFYLALGFAFVLHGLVVVLLVGMLTPASNIVNFTSHRVSISHSVESLNPSATTRKDKLSQPVEIDEPPTNEKALAPKQEPKSNQKPKPTLEPKPQVKEESVSNQVATIGHATARVEKEKEKEAEVEPQPAEKVENVSQDRPVEPEKIEERAPEVQEQLAQNAESQQAKSQHNEAAPPQVSDDVPSQSADEPPSVRTPSYQIGSANNPAPTYPRRARSRGWEGDVLLGVHIDEQGNVTYVEILKSSNISVLDFAAHSTVSESWVFSPANEFERNLKGYVEVPISFRIE